MSKHWAGNGRDDIKVFVIVYALAGVVAVLVTSLVEAVSANAWYASGPIFLAAAVLATIAYPKIVQARAGRRR